MSKYNVAIFSRCLPYYGIDHAGGEFLLRAVEAMQEYADVTVVAIDSERNRNAVTSVRPKYRPILLAYRGLYATVAFALLRKIQYRLMPLSIPLGARHALSRQPELSPIIDEADVIEYQWTEMAGLHDQVRKRKPAAHIVVVAHDVVSQRLRREGSNAALVLRPLHLMRRWVAQGQEKKLLGIANRITTFSEKDAGILNSLAATSRVVVVPPMLYDPEMSRELRQVPGRCIFVGAFNRRENVDAADWLLGHIWPHVQRAVPHAELRLVGVGSDKYLAGVPGRLSTRVSATGYLDSLNGEYRGASLVLVPLRLGAGVKFKTITAMLWGIPVVSTPVGAEGIGSDRLYAGIHTDAEPFAQHVVKVLDHPELFQPLADEARRWAMASVGPEQFLQGILESHGRRAR